MSRILFLFCFSLCFLPFSDTSFFFFTDKGRRHSGGGSNFKNRGEVFLFIWFLYFCLST